MIYWKYWNSLCDVLILHTVFCISKYFISFCVFIVKSSHITFRTLESRYHHQGYEVCGTSGSHISLIHKSVLGELQCLSTGVHMWLISVWCAYDLSTALLDKHIVRSYKPHGKTRKSFSVYGLHRIVNQFADEISFRTGEQTTADDLFSAISSH